MTESTLCPGLSTSKPNAGSNQLDLRMIYGRPSVYGLMHLVYFVVLLWFFIPQTFVSMPSLLL